jgi:hypothetical protein
MLARLRDPSAAGAVCHRGDDRARTLAAEAASANTVRRSKGERMPLARRRPQRDRRPQQLLKDDGVFVSGNGTDGRTRPGLVEYFAPWRRAGGSRYLLARGRLA